jgi:hypothetical protein
LGKGLATFKLPNMLGTQLKGGLLIRRRDAAVSRHVLAALQ